MHSVKPTLLALAVMALVQMATAQRSILDGQQATLFHYSFIISDGLKLHLEDFAKDHSPQARADDMDPVTKLLINKTYQRIEQAIEERTGLALLPKETLTGKVGYNVYGYPCSKRKKAARRGSTPFYLKMEVQLSARNMVDDKTSYPKRKIKPYCGIKVTFYNQQGKKLHTARSTAKGNRWIILDRTALYGFIAMDSLAVTDEQQTLISVIDEAIESLKEQLPK